MKNKDFLYQALLLLLLTACSGNTKIANEQAEEQQAQISDQLVVEINETTFPDNAFRSFLLSKEYGSDSLLSREELDNVKKLDVVMRHIQDLKGIEYFEALEKLDCSMNQLTSLDISNLHALETLQCYDNKLQELDLSGNTKLKLLFCSQNKLNSLDVSNNTLLTLIFFGENQIKEKAMDRLIQSLPQATTSSTYYFTICGENRQKETNKWTQKQLNDVRAKGWTPYNMKGEEL